MSQIEYGEWVANKDKLHAELDAAGVPPFLDQTCRIAARVRWLLERAVLPNNLREIEIPAMPTYAQWPGRIVLQRGGHGPMLQYQPQPEHPHRSASVALDFYEKRLTGLVYRLTSDEPDVTPLALLPELQDVVAAKYVSVWDNGITLRTACLYERSRKKAADIDEVDIDGLGSLTDEYVELPDGTEIRRADGLILERDLGD